MFSRKTLCIVAFIFGQQINLILSDCVDGAFYSHSSNCSLFYQCSHGQLFELSCSEGLLFNPSIDVCDYPENVNCGNATEPTTTPATSTNTATPTVTISTTTTQKTECPTTTTLSTTTSTTASTSTTTEAFTNNPCNGDNWVAFEDEKCFKLIKKWVTRSGAEQLCSEERLQTESSVPTLVSIQSAAEQTYLTKYIFETSEVESNVWIGAKRIKNEKQFVWDDDSDLKFTHWAEGSPTDETGRDCVEMQSPIWGTSGKWRDITCEIGNYVVCEKLQRWSWSQMQQALLDIKKELNEFRKYSKHMQTNLQNELESLQRNPVPIGFVYVQLSGEPEPSNLWPNIEWENVSSKYAGLFFRVLGGNSAAFGETQNENSPRISEIRNLVDNGSHHINISADGNWSSPLWTGGDTYCITGTPTCYWSTFFKQSSGEVRPRNSAVKIWKRIP